MKNIPKAGLLIVTLVIPALIFLFLTLFGTNHYNLPYFNPEKNASGQIVVQNGDTLFRKVGEICPGINQGQIEGKIIVLSSIPENCNDTCDLVIASLERVADLKDHIRNLEIVSFLALKEGDRKKADYSKIFKPVWLKLNLEETLECFSANTGRNDTIPPNNKLLLIDSEGFFRGIYDGTKEAETDRLMAEIKILDYESKEHNKE